MNGCVLFDGGFQPRGACDDPDWHSLRRAWIGANALSKPFTLAFGTWRPSSWQAGVFTIVRFKLVTRGSGTRIVFDQAGLLTDEDRWKHLDEGWPRNYWEPLRKYLGK
jgi:Activator of Hsp90 ATPase homolog 1-like protein